MKRKILTVGIAISILLWTGLGYTFENEPEGFRGLKWGDPPTESMKYLNTFEDERTYTLPDDKMSMGNVELFLIAYSFYGGIEDAGLTALKDQSERFMLVTLGFWKEENFDLLKTICRGKFGEATEESYKELDWTGQKALVSLVYDMVKGRGNLTIGSIQIFREKMETQKQKEIEEAEEDW